MDGTDIIMATTTVTMITIIITVHITIIILRRDIDLQVMTTGEDPEMIMNRLMVMLHDGENLQVIPQELFQTGTIQALIRIMAFIRVKDEEILILLSAGDKEIVIIWVSQTQAGILFLKEGQAR